MKAIIFSLKTLQPLLATSFQGDPNSDVSYPFIPGSMIRGALIGRYMKQQHIRDLDDAPDQATIKRLFFNASSTRYLNAYLQGRNGKRTLPIPCSWYKDKDDEFDNNSSQVKIYDISLEADLDLEMPQALGDGFWCNEGGLARLYTVDRLINIHTQRDRKKGRATKEKGAVFRYEAISPGQSFQGTILCEDIDELVIHELLKWSKDIWLGGSQSAGYGHTELDLDSIQLKSDGSEVEDNPEVRQKRCGLVITLLSDTLLRNEYGQPIADPYLLKQSIENILDTQLPELQQGGIFAKQTLIGGFNRKWGLPLPQLPAIAAGSVFSFKSDNCPLNAEQIKCLENQGIGERREDGFGCVVVNWLDNESFLIQQADQHHMTQASLSSESQLIAEQMAKRMLQKQLENLLVEQVGYIQIKGNIANSQLSRLRLVARQSLSTGGCNNVSALLNNLPSKARTQFETAKINSKSLLEQLEEWLANPGNWISNPPTVTIADIEYSTDFQMREEYTLRLIIAVAKKATKEVE
jgi:CRISPR-associated protein Csx10